MSASMRIGLMLLLSAGAAAAPLPERVQFDSLDGPDDGRIRLEGMLLLPPGRSPEGGRPAVIALHGCSGLFGRGGDEAALAPRYERWAASLASAGYVVLMPDSFGPRGRREICTVAMRERTITAASRRLDALGALDWLGRRPDVDPARIALLGWSHGGSTVLAAVNAGDARVAARRDGESPFFKTAIAFYPGCAPVLRDDGWMPATPLAILIGGDDDWTPPQPCESLAARAQRAGWPLEVVVYPGAHHGFDAPTGKVRLRRDVPNGVTPGAGVHVGPHPQAREQAGARVAAILRDALAR